MQKNNLISLKTIKQMQDSINIKDNLINNFDVINCYGYCLNMNLSYKDLEPWRKYFINVFNVGTLCNISKLINTDYDLEKSLYGDVEILGLNIKEIDFNEKLLENEWKIAMYNTPIYKDDDEYQTDFHFIKQNPNSNWFGKYGYSCYISSLDDYGRLIINPKEAIFTLKSDDDEIRYNYIGTYKLSLKKTIKY